jgi:diguanylate cyclase (GGDEF)-like protein
MMKALKALLFAYLHSGAKSTNTDEANRRILIIHLFSLIGVLITGIAATFAFINQNSPLSSVLFLSSFIFVLGPITQRITGNYRLSSSIVLYLLYVLMFYLLYSGGANNTGPLWIFMTAPVTLFICGLRFGILNLTIFTAVMSFILLAPFDFVLATQYPLDYKLRLISSFLTVSALTALYEYSRETSYRSMQEISQKFEGLSKLDPLTQLSNRRDATNIIEYEQRRLSRNQTALSIIICDIDNFKNVNDQFGHDVGDCVLVELAKVFKKCVRTQDTVARWGGEEFLFILPDTSSDQAIVIANKIHKAIKNSNPLCKSEMFDTTVSMGVSTVINDKNIDIDIAIKAADKNLYKAKNTGKNKTCSHSEEIIPE